ncbi:bifunctional DNA primase/polymerase [Corynebacterium sp. 11A]|uniref:bifunctional DNA primase/polymerase n=1 Tax=Corynebacterium sp. 11A TaxID=2080510 RepID=UPI00124C9EB3|nr:bifunctional DNA primase/polymerase [Corynebacterium sp. 11A]
MSKAKAPATQARAITNKWVDTNNCNMRGVCPHARYLNAVSHQHAMAILYARWGIAVGALNGKKPFTLPGIQEHGVKDFTTDEALIRRMWQACPHANIGARPCRGLVVLDVDPRNDGHTTWHTTNACMPPEWLPNTLVTGTGSGGWHEWYRLPYQLPVKGHAGQGIDVKTHKGYLVMPGSIHPDTGKEYVCRRWTWPPAQLPKHWIPHVCTIPTPARHTPQRARALRSSAHHGLVEAVAHAVEGQRNSTLHWAACRATEDGLNIEQELFTAAQAAGLADTEIQATLASARTTVMQGV